MKSYTTVSGEGMSVVWSSLTCIVDNTPFETISAPSFMHLYSYLPDATSKKSSWSQNADTGLHMKIVTHMNVTT
jgi:hypothetical protein